MGELEIDSAFRVILIAARRAAQLIDGARPRLEGHGGKPTTTALAELESGLVPWRVVTAEEYEILRQEELAAREREEAPSPFLQAPRPPVPLLAEVDQEDEDEEEELEDDPGAAEFEEDALGEVDESLADALLAEPPAEPAE